MRKYLFRHPHQGVPALAALPLIPILTTPAACTDSMILPWRAFPAASAERGQLGIRGPRVMDKMSLFGVPVRRLVWIDADMYLRGSIDELCELPNGVELALAVNGVGGLPACGQTAIELHRRQLLRRHIPQTAIEREASDQHPVLTCCRSTSCLDRRVPQPFQRSAHALHQALQYDRQSAQLHTRQPSRAHTAAERVPLHSQYGLDGAPSAEKSRVQRAHRQADPQRLVAVLRWN